MSRKVKFRLCFTIPGKGNQPPQTGLINYHTLRDARRDYAKLLLSLYKKRNLPDWEIWIERKKMPRAVVVSEKASGR